MENYRQLQTWFNAQCVLQSVLEAPVAQLCQNWILSDLSIETRVKNVTEGFFLIEKMFSLFV